MGKIISVSDIGYESSLNIYYVDCEYLSDNESQNIIRPFFFPTKEEAEEFISNINIKYDRNYFFS